MPRYAYVNGAYLPHRTASVHIEDRGYQFADGVYEVVALIDGRLADETGHLDRLERSLGELAIAMPVRRETLSFLIRELVRKNRLRNANIYIQVTRGVARRDFPYPAGVRPSLVITSWPFRFSHAARIDKGFKVITVPDLRWKRRDIKSIALLPQAMAKQKAKEAGAYEAWMVDDDGTVTEGASSNSWIVTRDNRLVTRQVSNEILKGVTRTALARLCAELQIKIEERAFTPQEAYEAAEAFCSSAVALVTPVTEIDGHLIGDGHVGPVTKRIYEEYLAYAGGDRGEQLNWEAG